MRDEQFVRTCGDAKAGRKLNAGVSERAEVGAFAPYYRCVTRLDAIEEQREGRRRFALQRLFRFLRETACVMASVCCEKTQRRVRTERAEISMIHLRARATSARSA